MNKMSQERRTAMAILLSILVILVYNEAFVPKPQRPETPIKESSEVIKPGQPDSNPQVSTPPVPSQVGQAANIAKPVNTATKIPDKETYENSQKFSVKTNLFTATFSTLGGRLLHFKLNDHRTTLDDATPLELVSVENNIFPLGVYVSGLQDAAVQYSIPEGGVTAGARLSGSTYSLPESGEMSLVLKGTLANGNEITKTFKFQQNKYLFDIGVSLSQPSSDGSPVWLEWAEYLDQSDESLRWNPKQFSVLDNSSDLSRITPDNIEGPAQDFNARWASFGSSYFTAVLLNSESGTNTTIGHFGDSYYIRSRGDTKGGAFQMYLGPKNRESLREYGHDLHRTVDLGWFAFIGDPILHGIHLLYRVLGNYGLAIIALTLLIKTALLPLTKTSFKSMKAMQDLQPEIKALKERIKDPNQLNQDVMALYQKRGVNPLGGCFPLILQMPIFLGMYNALQRDIDLRHAPFALWVNDLSAPEGLDVFGITVPVMILLMGASMLWQQITTPSAGDPAQKRAMYAVPVIFTVMFVFFPFPSGLVLYWLINNIISIVQQMALRSEEGANPLRATLISSVVVFIVSFILTLL